MSWSLTSHFSPVTLSCSSCSTSCRYACVFGGLLSVPYKHHSWHPLPCLASPRRAHELCVRPTKQNNKPKKCFFFLVTLFYVHSCSFYFDMNLFLWQYIRVQCLTSLFMCRLLLELTLVENLVGKSTHSLGPCCLEHLGCCFYLLFFHTYRLFVSWCFYFVLYSC